MIRHYVRNIHMVKGDYIVDCQFRAKYLVGAGGTQCPVYRTFFREAKPLVRGLQALALECEFPFVWNDEDCHLWFFGKGLPGYSWYVPKANGFLNVGLGAIVHGLKSRRDDIKNHWDLFLDQLGKTSTLPKKRSVPKVAVTINATGSTLNESKTPSSLATRRAWLP